MCKKNIAVLFGTKSSEHSISIKTASSIVKNIDQEKYCIFPIAICKDGRWFIQDNDINKWELRQVANNRLEVLPTNKEVLLSPYGNWYIKDDFEPLKIDVVFPALHGAIGEDGNIQGLLNTLNTPYVGQDIYGSFISAQKHLLKMLLDKNDIKNSPYIVLSSTEYKNIDFNKIVDVFNSFNQCVFVKPSNSGSSYGVSKVTSLDELESAIDLAFTFDKNVLIEKAITARELEVAVLGNKDNIIATEIGEVIVSKDVFYDFDEKYSANSSSKTTISPSLSEKCIENVKNTAKKAYEIIEGRGLARIDFLLDEQENIYLNEINTLPGFVEGVSLFPSLMKKANINYKDLISLLIESVTS